MDSRERRPKGCESRAHVPNPFVTCWGYLRTCPSCRARVCYEDGAADDVDLTLPGICDACADAGLIREPKGIQP